MTDSGGKMNEICASYDSGVVGWRDLLANQKARRSGILLAQYRFGVVSLCERCTRDGQRSLRGASLLFGGSLDYFFFHLPVHSLLLCCTI